MDGPTVETRPAPAHPYPSARSAYYTMFVLGVVVMFTILDRQVLALMIEPIKADYHISDTQAALLLGAAFSLTYAIAGLPLARIADVSNRRNLIALCIAFWSTATMACGIAQNYTHLFIARLGIGIGEAGYAPATWSMVTDSFPREKVAFATGTIAIGGHMGNGLALILGGSALALVAAFPMMELPFIGQLRPWQWAFIIVGLPGLLWALVVMTLKEPMRRGLVVGVKQKSIPAIEVVRWLAADWRTYFAIIGGMCVKTLMSMGTSQWMPSLFRREFDWSLTHIGLAQGSVVLAVGPLGLILGGKLSEYLHRRGMIDADMKIVFYALMASIGLSATFPLVGNPYLMLALYGCNIFVASLGIGPGTAAFQVITPNRMRAQVSAIYMFAMNVVGFALGPLVVALFTDFLFNDPKDLKYSLSLCAVLLGPIALLVIAQGMKAYKRSYARAIAEFG
ncbi:putative L-galactonate transporter [Brevundimonas subvibrioides]|uniref:spinster family MFS transporter n=1 Tax=Brevundimonas subvibrioides TaxID=74313 RepID=UPI0032D58D63